MGSSTHDSELDRLCELASIGAGHAATAFAQLAGHTVRMRPPRVVALDARFEAAQDDGWTAGVCFELEGCLNALVGVLFRRSGRDAIVHRLVGDSAPISESWCIESVLMEVGNILVSHVASAVADTLGERLVPSLPQLSSENPGEELRVAAAARTGPGAARIECELVADGGAAGGLLVMVPLLPAPCSLSGSR